MMTLRKPESAKVQTEQILREEALRVAKSIQEPGQTKEQTRLIAKGIEKGIALYKQQQQAKLREREKAKRKWAKEKERTSQLAQKNDEGDADIHLEEPAPATAPAALYVAGGVFGLVALLHLLRLALAWRLQIADYDIALGWSWAGAILAGGLACWMFYAAKQA